MSKKTPGGFHHFEFWVYDVCQGLVFAEMITAVEETAAPERPQWMNEILPDLRLHAAINDLFISIDTWADGHEKAFTDLVAQARDRLIERDTVTPEQAAAWIVLDDLPIHWRGSVPISTAPAVEFADALIRIVQGTFPAAPVGRCWYFGAHTPSGEIATIGTGAD